MSANDDFQHTYAGIVEQVRRHLLSLPNVYCVGSSQFSLDPPLFFERSRPGKSGDERAMKLPSKCGDCAGDRCVGFIVSSLSIIFDTCGVCFLHVSASRP